MPTFAFVTTWSPTITHAGVTNRPAFNPGNPSATAVTCPMSQLEIIRLGGEPNATVFRYTAAGAAVNTGLVFPRACRNANSSTAQQVTNADGTLVAISRRFAFTGEATNSVSFYLIDVTGQYSGGVPWRIIRASSGTLDGISGQGMWFWDPNNPLRVIVKDSNGQVREWFPIGTSGQNPAGPGTVNVILPASAASSLGLSDFDPQGGRHDLHTSRNGRWHVSGCRRSSDLRYGGIRLDLQNRQYVGPFVPTLQRTSDSSRPALRQTSSRTGRYSDYQGANNGDFNIAQIVDLTNGANVSVAGNADNTHCCMIDFGGREYQMGGRGNTHHSQTHDLLTGQMRTVARVPQSNPTHFGRLLKDRYEQYPGNGPSAGDRYVIQTRSTTGGGGHQSIIAIRMGPNITNTVRYICHTRGISDSNYNECHANGVFVNTTRGGFVIFPSNWAVPGNAAVTNVSPYAVILPPAWSRPLNSGL